MENLIIYLKEAGRILKYKDCRSVKVWCSKMQVKVFTEKATQRAYVIKAQFEYALTKDIIDYLKVKFKDNWPEAFKAYADLDLTWIITMENKMNSKIIKRKNGYKIKGDKEQSILSHLTNINPEL